MMDYLTFSRGALTMKAEKDEFYAGLLCATRLYADRLPADADLLTRAYRSTSEQAGRCIDDHTAFVEMMQMLSRGVLERRIWIPDDVEFIISPQEAKCMLPFPGWYGALGEHLVSQLR